MQLILNFHNQETFLWFLFLIQCLRNQDSCIWTDWKWVFIGSRLKVNAQDLLILLLVEGGYESREVRELIIICNLKSIKWSICQAIDLISKKNLVQSFTSFVSVTTRSLKSSVLKFAGVSWAVHQHVGSSKILNQSCFSPVNLVDTFCSFYMVNLSINIIKINHIINLTKNTIIIFIFKKI